MSRKVKLDPLDSVRITDPAASPGKTSKAKQQPAKPRVPKVPEKPTQAAPKPTPKIPEPTKPPEVQYFKVMAMARRSMRGQMCVYKLGRILSSRTQQPIIELLQNSHVPLLAVDEAGNPLEKG